MKRKSFVVLICAFFAVFGKCFIAMYEGGFSGLFTIRYCRTFLETNILFLCRYSPKIGCISTDQYGRAFSAYSVVDVTGGVRRVIEFFLEYWTIQTWQLRFSGKWHSKNSNCFILDRNIVIPTTEVQNLINNTEVGNPYSISFICLPENDSRGYQLLRRSCPTFRPHYCLFDSHPFGDLHDHANARLVGRTLSWPSPILFYISGFFPRAARQLWTFHRHVVLSRSYPAVVFWWKLAVVFDWLLVVQYATLQSSRLPLA